ncbi:alpha-L-fucosidase [Maribellus sp. CM-23]|uniref:alpha-L-fucosidase n=1 Tax=Maribellus sp. CM-23 TaxID=2781026 RepID=UPI001F41C5C0|nr:alpha-L-fucosidase [Maribellus sp. CM-23]MCE4566972.1 alpha-L-fucosidase [Maribellus sp. CM-23]
MRKTLPLLFLAIIFGCSNPSGQLMEPMNTISVDQDDTNDSIIAKAAHVVPTPNQMDALSDEFIAFIHFGPNTFTRMEWGNGMEDPRIFDLRELDTDQWCQAMKAAGMTKVIFTAKHHDGFCLWQSRYTEHGIMASPFKDGKGDVLKDLAESCENYGLKLGVYLSPADLFQIENPEGLYGNLSKKTERIIPRPIEGRPFENKTTFKFTVDDYNEYFLNQLFELLTEYGPVHEVWFDGAHPKRKGGQTYDYMAWKELIRTLAPEAVIFGREDIRWCGNESGKTRDTEWNVIPYQENPDIAEHFPDMTDKSLGSREQLFQAKFLHYQQAETNTSIREGWFYRDETSQKVRNADDVFDIYERSVGGNSTFLLNIPPNREGRFSDEDVQVLEEVGKRIEQTYGTDLLRGAKGPAEVLDNDPNSYKLLADDEKAIEITMVSEVEANRFVIQEAIASHSERIEKHALDAWIDNQWQEVASATNVGYKRILRFPTVTTSKWRLRILESRMAPAIAKVSAHYYKNRPPQLAFSLSIDGQLTIEPKKHDFSWKPHGEDISRNINNDLEIRYTLDGSEPTNTSKLYTAPFFHESGQVKARSFTKDQAGSVAEKTFGIIKKGWKLVGADQELEGHTGTMAFDENSQTYWTSTRKGTHFLSIDLGQEQLLSGFVYTPQTANADGMIEEGLIKTSTDGKSWETLEAFKFGNLINDPTPRTHYFNAPVSARFFRIESRVIAGGNKAAAIAEIDFLKTE